MTTQLCKVSRSCATALVQLAICGVLPFLNAHAQVPPRVERVSGVWRASLSTLPVTTAYWYPTPGEAFAAHAAWWAARLHHLIRGRRSTSDRVRTQQFGYSMAFRIVGATTTPFFTEAFFNTAERQAQSRGIRSALKIGRAYMLFRLREGRRDSRTKFDSHVNASYRPHNVRCLPATA